MDWIFDNLQILIAAAAGVAYWLNQRKEAQELEQQQREESAYEPDDYDASDDEARARQIREEIRRKIAERSGGSRPVILQEPIEQPPPLFERPREDRPPVADPYAHDEWREKPEAPVGPSAAERAVLERQKRLEERMRELATQKVQTKKLATVLTPRRRTRSKSNGLRSLRDDLRETDSLRRAVVLREVLGPPVGLQ